MSLIVKTAELAVAAPQVVAYRVARMALAGAYPTVRDRDEFQRMATEKMAAFSESWGAMAAETARANLSLAASVWRMAWFPWLSGKPPAAWHFPGAALEVLGKGIAPVHRRAVANARRLARTKLR